MFLVALLHHSQENQGHHRIQENVLTSDQDMIPEKIKKNTNEIQFMLKRNIEKPSVAAVLQVNCYSRLDNYLAAVYRLSFTS